MAQQQVGTKNKSRKLFYEFKKYHFLRMELEFLRKYYGIIKEQTVSTERKSLRN